MNLQVGNLVTLENYRTGKPYRKYYGLLSSITNKEQQEALAQVSIEDPHFIFCFCKIDWISAPVHFLRTEVNATYVREYNNV